MSRFVTFGHEKLGQITEGASSGLQSGLSGTKRVLSGIVNTVVTVPDLPHNLAAVASRSEVGGKVATFFGGLTGSESGGQRKKSRADVLVNDDSFGDTAEATVTLAETTKAEGETNELKYLPYNHRPSAQIMLKARDTDGWMDAGTIIKIDKRSADLNVEVFKFSFQTIHNRLTLLEAQHAQPVLADNASGNSARVRSGAFNVKSLFTTKDKNINGSKMLTAVRESVKTTLQKLMQDNDPDKAYVAALREFDHTLGTNRLEQIVFTGGTMSDLVSIFDTTLQKQVDKLDARAKADHKDPTHVEDFNKRMSRFVAVLNDARKKFVDDTDPSDKSAETERLVRHVRRALNIDDELHGECLLQVKDITRQDVLMELARRLVELDRNPYYNSVNFGSAEAFGKWKVQERSDLLDLMMNVDPAAYAKWEEAEREANKKKSPSGPHKIMIKVVAARNLTAKDKGGTSDPFARIEYGDQAFETKVIYKNLNPRWDEQVTIKCDDLSVPIKISLWDHDDPEEVSIFSRKFLIKDETNDFLGQVSLDAREIVSKSEPTERWFPLQQRSKRSNISGDLHLFIFDLPLESSPASSVSTPLEPWMTTDYHGRYMYLQRELFRYDMASLKVPTLSGHSRTILSEFARRYRIGTVFQNIAYMAYLVEAHQNVDVDMDSLLNSIHDVQELISNKMPATNDEKSAVGRSFEIIFDFLLLQVCKFDTCFNTHSLRSLELAIRVLATIYEDPLFQHRKSYKNKTFKELLTENLKIHCEQRFARLSEEANPDVSNPTLKLENLSEILGEQIDTITERYQRPFLVTSDIDILVVDSFILLSNFLDEIQRFAEFQTPDDEKARDFIALYLKLKNFRETYVDIPPPKDPEHTQDWVKLKQEFKIEKLFYPYVVNLLKVTHKLLIVWARNALDTDTFKPIDSSALHSISVVDVFSTFFAALEVLKKLQWGDSTQKAEFYSEFVSTLSLVIQDYSQVLLDQVKEAYKKIVAQSEQQKTNFFANVFGSKMTVSPFEVTQQSCVKVNNVEALRLQLRELRDLVDAELGHDEEQADGSSAVLDDNADVRSMAPTVSPSVQFAPSGATIGEDEEGSSGEPATVTGVIKLEIINAVGLRALDINGKSDPFVVVTVINRDPNQAAAPATPTKGPSTPTTPQVPTSPTTPVGVNAILKGVAAAASKAHATFSDQGQQQLMHKVAQTKIIPATLNPIWDERFEFAVKDAERILFQVFDHDLVSRPELCGQIELSLTKDGYSDGHVHSLDLDLEPQGTLKMRIQSKSNSKVDADFHFIFTFRAIKRFRSDILDVFVNGMQPYLRECIQKMLLSAKPKAGGMFASKVDQSATQDDVQNSLQPLFTYLDSNLATLAVNLYPGIREEILWKTWKAVLRELQVALVPTIEVDSVGGKKGLSFGKKTVVLTAREHTFVVLALDSLKVFFYADGKGLSSKNLEGSKYQAVKYILDNYFAKTAILIALHIELANKSKPKTNINESTEHDKTDQTSVEQEQRQAILQLLHMRETDRDAQDFVNDIIKANIYTKKWSGN